MTKNTENTLKPNKIPFEKNVINALKLTKTPLKQLKIIYLFIIII